METPLTPLSFTRNSEEPELKLNSPQDLIVKFWFNYHAEKAGKVTSVLPPSYFGLSADSELSRPSPLASTYEEAAQQCRDNVQAIVQDCERTNNKFSDPEFDIEKDFFSCEYNCLFGITRAIDDGDNQPTKPGSVHRIPWIFEEPQFVTENYISDIKQGASSSCWWLAALASVASRQDLIETLCIARNENCGVYGFVFYKDGGWISTVVDDNLYLTSEDFDWELYDSAGLDSIRSRSKQVLKHCSSQSVAALMKHGYHY
ncbi:unnamed protein product [Fusarium langsethiae]|nr:unnamed protein product [Fusarium langsethiae]